MKIVLLNLFPGQPNLFCIVIHFSYSSPIEHIGVSRPSDRLSYEI